MLGWPEVCRSHCCSRFNVLAGLVCGLLILVNGIHAEPPAAGRSPGTEKLDAQTLDAETPNSKPDTETPAERGYRWLTTKCYLTPDFDQQVFDDLWQIWPQPEREQARQAGPEERRRLIFAHYGLVERPGDDGTGPALGHVPDGKGGWVMNCLTCHTGKVAGKTILGAPNTLLDLHSLMEDVRTIKLSRGIRLAHLDAATIKIPLSTTRGTTNAVVFGVAVGATRDKDLNYRRPTSIPHFVHNDMDAPPFWNVRKKTRGLYADGFAAYGPRPLMQFVLIPRNSAETLKSWEPEFADLLAWIESLPVPEYPWKIDRELAAAGEQIFERSCARCHGTYGDQPEYPGRIVPLDEVQTDGLRLQALEPDYRQLMHEGWFGHYGQDDYLHHPNGYVAPPLDGLWASAPYLHNGSVPTLWHLLHPEERPVVWKRTSDDGYDQQRVGLPIEAFEAVPKSARAPVHRRRYFNTKLPGKSAAGHPFVNVLTEEEKQAVLEYLKSL